MGNRQSKENSTREGDTYASRDNNHLHTESRLIISKASQSLSEVEHSVCPVCLDLRWDLFPAWPHFPTQRQILIEFGRLSQQKGCLKCQYVLAAILDLTKPLVARNAKFISSLQGLLPHKFSIQLLEGYITRIGVYGIGGVLPEIELYTPIGMPVTVEVFGTAPDRPPILDLATCTQFIRTNLQKCKASHLSCYTKVAKMPTRVLYLGSLRSPCLRLVERLPIKQRYIALSHCWGPIQIITTTKSTLTERLLDIPWDSLSKTFQDAIEITRSLEISFLWIDSLCIIQDDASDWESESVKMAQVYSNAYITIAAAGAHSGTIGCLFPRWNITPKGLKLPCSISQFQSGNDPPSPKFNARCSCKSHGQFEGEAPMPSMVLVSAPLWTRAWVFQERLLSNRTIHFHSEEMIWECEETTDCECGFYAWENNRKAYQDLALNSEIRKFISRVRQREGTKGQAFKIWSHILREFTTLEITYQSDKLPALSGIATILLPAMESRCIAGIWDYEMAIGLMWRQPGFARSRRVKVSAPQYIPTWSWASLEMLSHSYMGLQMPFSPRGEYSVHSNAAFSCIPRETSDQIVSFLTIEDAVLRIRGWCAFCKMGSSYDNMWRAFKRHLTFQGRKEGKFTADISDETIEEASRDNGDVICVLLGSTTTRNMEENRKVEHVYQLALVLQTCGSEMEGRFRRVGLFEISVDYAWFEDAEVMSFEVI